MTTLANIISDANSVLALEPEEIAGIVLELIASAGPNEPSRLHPSSLTSAQTIGQFPQHQAAAHGAQPRQDGATGPLRDVVPSL